jgi:L-ascorbate metabolism protein UlaG (beta-lactamase superfamily)
MSLKAARIKDENFIEEVDQYRHDEKNFHLWWLGQSGYLLLWQGQQVLIDPYLSDSLTKKYADTKKPHTRISERVVDPQLLKNISIVTSSHNHTDHLDGATLIPVINNNPGITFIIPEANRDFVCERIHMPREFPVGLTDGKTIEAGIFSFHGVPAKHDEIERDAEGNCKFLGYIIRFGHFTIYHSGDTLWYDGMVDMLKPFHIDVALLPINGQDPARGVAGNLNAQEAASLGKALGAGVVIPCHYDMFAFNTADPKDFEAEAKKIGQPYGILEQGGHFIGSNQPISNM